MKCLQSDGGGEYTSNKFTKFCKDHGILQRISVPSTPQQNGLAERKNRTLLNSARSMLNLVSLLPSFWEEAVATTCYLQNRNYHRTLGLITPYELWFGVKPNMQDLKIFGCLAYAFVPAEKRSKLEQRARKAIFVGYGDANGYKAYRLFDPTKKTFFYSRTVKFDESTFLESTTPRHSLKNDIREGGKQLEDDAAIVRQSHNNDVVDVCHSPNSTAAATSRQQKIVVADDCRLRTTAAFHQQTMVVANNRHLPTSVVVAAAFRHLKIVVVDDRRLSTSVAAAASHQQNIVVVDDRLLPQSTAADAAFCYQHKNIDDDNSHRCHRQKDVYSAAITVSN